MTQASPSLKERINEDMKHAMRARDKQRLAIIRLIMAAIKQREVDERIALDDAGVLAVLDKMIKQRRDSADQYQAAGRNELMEQESYEIRVIQEYLPQPLSAQEIDTLVVEAIRATQAASPKDMGKVMGALRPRVQGRADMGTVSAKVKERLAAL